MGVEDLRHFLSIKVNLEDGIGDKPGVDTNSMCHIARSPGFDAIKRFHAKLSRA